MACQHTVCIFNSVNYLVIFRIKFGTGSSGNHSSYCSFGNICECVAKVFRCSVSIANNKVGDGSVAFIWSPQ